MSRFLEVKPLNQILEEAKAEGGASLKPVLGRWNLVSLGIGVIIGAGIFVLTGSAAAQYAGPALTLSFIIAAIGCAFAGLCYSEFASLIPIAGSAYTYGYASLGELVAWIIGWDLVLEYSFGCAAVASGWSGYFVSLMSDWGWTIPAQFTASPGVKLIMYEGRWCGLDSIMPTLIEKGIDPNTLQQVTGSGNLVALAAVLLAMVVLVLGMKESAQLTGILVVIKLAIVFTFIGVAGYYLMQHPQLALDNWTPFIPDNLGEFGKYGWSGVARGAGVIFFAYLGFDAVSTAAQEAKNPQRDMPFGILGSLLICTILYVAVAGLLTGLVNYTHLNVSDPVALGIDVTGIGWGILLVKIGAVVGLAGVVLVMLMAQTRVLYSMSRDGLLPAWGSVIHPRFNTPWIGTIVTGVLVSLIAALVPMDVLGHMVSIGTLLAFVIVCGGIIVLRVKRPDLPRPFRTPWSPWVPIMGMTVSLSMMVSLPLTVWIRLIVWLAIGLVLYFVYGAKHSHVQQAIEAAGQKKPQVRPDESFRHTD